jgi:hypothetical protein
LISISFSQSDPILSKELTQKVMELADPSMCSFSAVLYYGDDEDEEEDCCRNDNRAWSRLLKNGVLLCRDWKALIVEHNIGTHLRNERLYSHDLKTFSEFNVHTRDAAEDALLAMRSQICTESKYVELEESQLQIPNFDHDVKTRIVAITGAVGSPDKRFRT